MGRSALTHGHPDGWAPSGMMALTVRRLLADASWTAAIEAGLAALTVHPTAIETRTLLAEVATAVGSGAARASSSFGRVGLGMRRSVTLALSPRNSRWLPIATSHRHHVQI